MCLGVREVGPTIISLEPDIISNFYQMDSHIGQKGGCWWGSQKKLAQFFLGGFLIFKKILTGGERRPKS